MDFFNQFSAGELLLLSWTNRLVRYFLVAGSAYLIFWKFFFVKFQHKFLYEQRPEKKHMIREVKFSVLTTLIFMLPSTILYNLKPYGISRLYFEISDYPLWWYALSFLAVFLMHDTYFYWTHRLMHHRKLYSTFHKIHHLSVSPTPWAAFAFHPLESIVESMIFVIIPFVFPVHWTVLITFTFFSLLMNVYGHLGFNLFSPKIRDSFPLNLLSHSTHHSWHHRYYNGNFGFYLKFWDKMMGTYKGELK